MSSDSDTDFDDGLLGHDLLGYDLLGDDLLGEGLASRQLAAYNLATMVAAAKGPPPCKQLWS